jgi:hypothetical protein
VSVATERSAVFSACRVYRYRLMRSWGVGPRLGVIGLNPSTADETDDDQTIRRCISLAQRDGYGALTMLNLFAFRATDPRDLARAGYPTGPSNMEHILMACVSCDCVVAAWGSGTPRVALRTIDEIAKAGIKLWCWGKTKDYAPRHPSRLSNSAKLSEFNP